MSLLTISPVLWAAVATLAVVASWLLAGTRYRWLAGAVAVTLALPRFLLYEISFLVAGLAPAPGREPRGT